MFKIAYYHANFSKSFSTKLMKLVDYVSQYSHHMQ